MMKDTIIGLFGAGGFSREVMPFAKRILSLENQSMQFCFVETTPQKQSANNIELLSAEEFFSLECREKFFNIAIANSKVREKLANSCIARGVSPCTLIASNTTIYDEDQIAEGAIICANSIITSNVKIGKFFHSNIYSYVAHDCVIGDYVTFAPSVHCNGNVHIGNHAYIGTGAIIKQGTAEKPLIIGEGAVIGMGAVVTKDVLPFKTVIGNPAKPFEKMAR
jgi:sugar O-acyltransferase (sialic acid O-acetyltransferase NeuD family)